MSRIAIFSFFPSIAVLEVQSPIFLDQVTAFLPDHDDGSVGVPRDDIGHDGGVNHPEPDHAVHLELVVDDRRGVGGPPHLGGPGVMINRGGKMTTQARQVLVGLRN